MPKETKILVSLFHTPTDASREVFYCVLRAGHLIAGLDYRQVHPNYPGHKLLLCLMGHGFIRVTGRTWPVGPGQVAWIFNHHENAHWPAEGSPWEMYWIRVEGPKLDQIYKTLAASGSPVFTRVDAAGAAAIFLKRATPQLRQRPARRRFPPPCTGHSKPCAFTIKNHCGWRNSPDWPA